MNVLKQIAAALVLLGAAAGANADAVIITPDGTKAFGGFDWASNGSILVSGYQALSGTGLADGFSSNFTVEFQAYTGSIFNKAGVNQFTPGLRMGSGTGYEYTIDAKVTENVTCMGFDCHAVTITPLSGTYNIFYDLHGNADAAGITGIIDGTLLLSGILTGGGQVIQGQGPSNPGDGVLAATLVGVNTYTNSAYITPDLATTNVVSTLQFGHSITAWTRPSSFDGVGFIGDDTNTRYIGQADANEKFTVSAVPEPGAIALVGLALGVAGFVTRGRKQV